MPVLGALGHQRGGEALGPERGERGAAEGAPGVVLQDLPGVLPLLAVGLDGVLVADDRVVRRGVDHARGPALLQLARVGRPHGREAFLRELDHDVLRVAVAPHGDRLRRGLRGGRRRGGLLRGGRRDALGRLGVDRRVRAAGGAQDRDDPDDPYPDQHPGFASDSAGRGPQDGQRGAR
ncbi:hypothetical protein BU197_24775, partial [Streptomyces sp. CBMA291]|nr:hypothetical protein [Streptomyces sp. CBMA291]